MAGSAAARGLSLAPAAAADAPTTEPRTTCRLARPADDREVRRLLRANPFDGAIRLSLECEPDASRAAAIYGPVHQLIVAGEPGTGRLMAMACRAERDVFVNGRVERLGYLGQLRVDPPARRRPRLLADGFACCARLHAGGRAPAYLMSIVEDNRRASRLLTKGRWGGQPAFVPLEPFLTFVLPTRQAAWSDESGREGAGRLHRGTEDLTGAIADCLCHHGAARQFAPVWTTGDLTSPARTPGLSTGDFLLVREGDRVTACAAVWDQRVVRQAVVRGFSPWVSRTRTFVNLWAALAGTPRVPPAGTVLSLAYLSHLALHPDDTDAFGLLVRAGLAAARARGIEYLAFGLAARHPLAREARRRFRHRCYAAVLYLAYWPDGAPFVAALDGRLPHPEVAVL